MKERRKTIGQFSVSIQREKLDALTKKLETQNKTKTQWLNEKIDERNSANKENAHPTDQEAVDVPTHQTVV